MSHSKINNRIKLILTLPLVPLQISCATIVQLVTFVTVTLEKAQAVATSEIEYSIIHSQIVLNSLPVSWLQQ